MVPTPAGCLRPGASPPVATAQWQYHGGRVLRFPSIDLLHVICIQLLSCVMVAKCNKMERVSVSIYQKIPTVLVDSRGIPNLEHGKHMRFSYFQKPSRWLCVRLWRSSCMHRFSKSLSNNGRVRASRTCLVSSTCHCQDVAKDQSSPARSWAFFLASSCWAAVLANKILSLPTSRAFCVWSFWRMFLLIGAEQEEAPKNIREACEPLLLPSYETARDAGL